MYVSFGSNWSFGATSDQITTNWSDVVSTVSNLSNEVYAPWMASPPNPSPPPDQNQVYAGMFPLSITTGPGETFTINTVDELSAEQSANLHAIVAANWAGANAVWTAAQPSSPQVTPVTPTQPVPTPTPVQPSPVAPTVPGLPPLAKASTYPSWAPYAAGGAILLFLLWASGE